MSSPVLELQKRALNEEEPVSTLLRWALVISRKLDLVDFREWIEHELEGYGEDAEVPDYRMVAGQLKGRDPYHGGWMPVLFRSAADQELASKRSCGSPVAVLETLMATVPGHTIGMPVPPVVRERLAKDGVEEFVSFVDRSTIAAILSAVRNAILRWSLDLEEQGVLGTDLEFSEEEQESASDNRQTLNINAQSVVVQQGGPFSVFGVDQSAVDALLALVEVVRQQVPRLDSETDRCQIEEELERIESQMKAETPSIPILRSALEKLKEIVEGAATAVATSGVAEAIGRAIASLAS